MFDISMQIDYNFAMQPIERKEDCRRIKEYLDVFPVTGIIGPRQSGKTFLSKTLKANYYFDLENDRDLARLENPQLALEDLKGLIVIDEIQRVPNLFVALRYLVDNHPEQKYLILGSASGHLMRQSSESLAGRIGYYNFGGFSIDDVGAGNIKKLWLRGGLPRSFLAGSDAASFLWLDNYISTFLERDIPQLGVTIPAHTLRKFWMMLSHYHAQVLNYSELGRSFGISDVTVRRYVDILENTQMLRVLHPWHSNVSKRLVKRPKVYLRDAGVFHALMSIHSFDQLSVHNKIGASWEGFALECVAKSLNKKSEELFFWGTHADAELDLYWQQEGKSWGIEFKYADAPRITRSMLSAIQDLQLEHLWIIYPGKDTYLLDKKITVLPLGALPDSWKYPLK
jgi:predicted AAA+ superfamily ATPase